MTRGFGSGIPGDIYDHAPGYGCKAHDQQAYERDMQTNKITLDPVLPSMGAIGPELSNPVPGHRHSTLGETIMPVEGNTYRQSVVRRMMGS